MPQTNSGAQAHASANARSSGPCGFVQDDDVALTWRQDQSKTKAALSVPRCCRVFGANAANAEIRQIKLLILNGPADAGPFVLTAPGNTT